MLVYAQARVAFQSLADSAMKRWPQVSSFIVLAELEEYFLDTWRIHHPFFSAPRITTPK